MSDTRLTIRLNSRLRKALRSKAKALGKHESEIARSAIEKDVSGVRPQTLYDALAETGFIGCAPGGPPDLSSNKKYMEGFGGWDSDSYRRGSAGRAGRSSRRASSALRKSSRYA